MKIMSVLVSKKLLQIRIVSLIWSSFGYIEKSIGFAYDVSHVSVDILAETYSKIEFIRYRYRILY
jgi:hypothetical protein